MPYTRRVDLEAVMQSTRPLVFAVCRRMLGDQQTAEEAVMDTYFRVSQKSHLFDPAKGSLDVWVATIARNICRNILRKRTYPTVQLSDADWLAIPSEADMFEDTVNRERMEELVRALACLSHDHAQVLVAFGYGHSLSDIAHRLGCPTGTIKGRLTWGRRALRYHLERHGRDGGSVNVH